MSRLSPSRKLNLLLWLCIILSAVSIIYSVTRDAAAGAVYIDVTRSEPARAITLDEAVSASNAPGTLNINTATASELCRIPGIGPSKAAAIIEYRESVGGFLSVDELINVSGIGESTLESIRPYCRVK